MTNSGPVELYYFRGRGLGETVRFMLAAAGVEYTDCFVEEKEQMEKLRNDGGTWYTIASPLSSWRMCVQSSAW